MSKGPFARLRSEKPDENGELHIKVVPEDGRIKVDTDAFRARIVGLVREYLHGGSHDEGFRIRGSDTNNDALLAIVKSAVEEVAGEGKVADTIYKEFTKGGPGSVLTKEALWDGAYRLDVTKTTPTR